MLCSFAGPVLRLVQYEGVSVHLQTLQRGRALEKSFLQPGDRALCTTAQNLTVRKARKSVAAVPARGIQCFIPFPPSIPVIKFWYILEGKVIPFPSPCCLQATHRYMDVQKLESTSKQTQNQHLAQPGNSKSQNHQPLESAQLSHWCELPTQFWDTPCLEHTPSPVLPLL